MRNFVAVAVIAIASVVIAAGVAGGSAAQQRKPLRYAEHDLFIETNATDRDAGLQLDLDAEDWRSLTIRDPSGEPIVGVQAKGPLRPLGLTELFFEASEPSFDEVPFSRFKKRFPEGRYTFRGRTVEGRRLAGADRLSHVIPRRPNVTFPADGVQLDPNGFTVTWEPVTRPRGVDIATYVVTVVQGDRELNMDVPGSETSATIPGQFLEPGTRSELEVLAREKSGNQTITALKFRTR
jgi:Fibronectin type III domain